MLHVYDLLGKELFKEEGMASTGSSPLTTGSLSMTNEGYFTEDLNCVAFAKGMYLVSLQTEKDKLIKRFIKD